MDELLQVGIRLFETAPGPAALVAVAFLYFRGNNSQKQDKYVKREDCHNHIDGLKTELNKNFDSVHDDIRELRALLIGHIDSGRQN